MEGIHNELTRTIEKIMTDYGGNTWSKYTLSQFSADVEKRIIEASGKLKGSQKLVCSNLLNRLKKKGSIPDQLMVLNECYFNLTSPEEC